MNYDYFADLENGILIKPEEETEQAFMERILTAVFSEKCDELSNRVNDRMAPKFNSCSVEEKSMSIAFVAEEWMLNPNGTLHGGLLGTSIDIGMSVLSRYFAKKRQIVTVQLSINFLRAVNKGETFIVKITADHVGRRSIVMNAKVIIESTNKVAATASGLLM